MKKIILIEGPDGSGKSTLANLICQKCKASYIHLNRPKFDTVDRNQHDIVMDMAIHWQRYENVVIDRHWMSLLVYGEVFDNEKELEQSYSILKTNLYQYLHYIDKTIVCLPEETSHKKSFKELKDTREELFDNMDEVYNKYKRLWFGGNEWLKANFDGFCPAIRHDFRLYDYTKKYSETDILNWINT